MPRPLLVIITGLPATGKTTLGRRIAAELKLPFVYKDGIKELLFNTLGWSDIEWSQRLGRASTELLYYFAEAEVKSGNSCVLESNFDAALATPRFLALKEMYEVSIVQIVCKSDPDVIWQRYQSRWDAGQKHPGHVQHLDTRADSWIHWPQGRAAALNLDGDVIELDTTQFDLAEYEALVGKIRDLFQI